MKEALDILLNDLRDKHLMCDFELAKEEEHLETIRAKRDVFGKCIHMIEEVMEGRENG